MQTDHLHSRKQIGVRLISLYLQQVHTLADLTDIPLQNPIALDVVVSQQIGTPLQWSVTSECANWKNPTMLNDIGKINLY